MEPKKPEGQQVIEDQQGQYGLEIQIQDNNPLNRLVEWCRNLVRAILLGGRQQREKEKEELLAKIEQINIEELCSLSPEGFLTSPQFSEMIQIYNLLNCSETPITRERLQNNIVIGFIVELVLTLFINLRSHLTEDLQRASVLNQFKDRVVRYFDERGGGQQEPEVREECAFLDKDQLIGVPNIIRRFSKLGVVLQTDDDRHGSWYVVVKNRHCIVNFSYGQELYRMNQGRMSLIESGFRFNLLSKGEFIEALMTGIPSFDDLMKHIADKLPRT